MTHPPYLDVTQDAGRAFFLRGITGPVVMLNLLRLRDEADYNATPELAPANPISGRDAFDRYISHTLPFLTASGGKILFLGDGAQWLIGPSHECWDVAMLIEQASVESFMAWNSNSAYLAGLGHRTAAITDSQLLPLTSSSTINGTEF